MTMTERNPLTPRIDHFVLAVPTWSEGLKYLKELTAVDPTIGGIHPDRGTRNAIISLGKTCYLELLAIDHANIDIPTPRWMAVDQIDKPTITRWCIHSDNLANDAALLNRAVLAGNRVTGDGAHLQWKMSDPSSYPIVDVIPFLIDWSGSQSHPCKNLQQKCSITAIEIHSEDPTKTRRIFDQLQINTPVRKSTQNRMKLKIATPNGLIIL